MTADLGFHVLVQYAVCSYLMGGAWWDLTKECFLQQWSPLQYLVLGRDCSPRQFFTVKELHQKNEETLQSGCCIVTGSLQFLYLKGQGTRDIAVEAAESCFCLVLEGWECHLSCETTSRAYISKQEVNTSQNLQAPHCKYHRRVLAHGFLLVAEWGWSSLLAVIPVTHGYSKAKESATPTYHICCYFILQILVWISCWTNRQKESPVNTGDLDVCYMLNYYMQLTCVWIRTISEVTECWWWFLYSVLHNDLELTFLILSYQRWFITELVASHGYLSKNSEMESQHVSFPEEHFKSFEFCKMSWHKLRK